MKIIKKVSLTIFVVLLLLQSAFAADVPGGKCKAALLFDLNSGEALLEKDIHTRLFPASLTKIMTFLTVMDLNPSLDDVVTVEASMFEGLSEFGSSVNIKEGEEITVRALLECMMISSANEACNILAVHTFGSVEAFVNEMNRKAQALQLEDTHFMNPTGLHDDNHYTTAADLLIITREALKSDLFIEITSQTILKQQPTNLNKKGRTLVNTNNMLTKYRTADYFYPEATGIKTGFTTPAGNCLITRAKRGELDLLSIVLGCVKNEETGFVESYTETIALFEWGFENFTTKTLIRSTDPVLELPVTLAKDNDYVVLAPESSVTALVPKDLDPEKLERVLDVPESVEAPVQRGDILGSLTLKYEGKEYGKVNLVTLSDATRSEFLSVVDKTSDTLQKPAVQTGVLIVIAVVLSYIALMIIVNLVKKKGAKRKNERRRRQTRGHAGAEAPVNENIDIKL